MISRPRLRPGRLAQPRPVPARRAVTGPIRLVVVTDPRDRASLIATSVVGVITLVAFGIGIVVTLP